MTFISRAILVLSLTLTLTLAHSFPSLDLFHSSCRMTVIYRGTLCATLYDRLFDVLDLFNAGGDPAKGLYQYKEKNPISSLWVTHKTQKGAVSDVLFETNQINNDCHVKAKSRS